MKGEPAGRASTRGRECALACTGRVGQSTRPTRLGTKAGAFSRAEAAVQSVKESLVRFEAPLDGLGVAWGPLRVHAAAIESSSSSRQ
jgi:hypothetical protein